MTVDPKLHKCMVYVRTPVPRRSESATDHDGDDDSGAFRLNLKLDDH